MTGGGGGKHRGCTGDGREVGVWAGAFTVVSTEGTDETGRKGFGPAALDGFLRPWGGGAVCLQLSGTGSGVASGLGYERPVKRCLGVWDLGWFAFGKQAWDKLFALSRNCLTLVAAGPQ